MTLSSAPPLRRGSTPVPFKYQLRREEAVNDDCDWTPGIGVTEATSPPPVSFVLAQDAQAVGADAEEKQGGPYRIALLGQNGVGKTSLAIALAGEMDRTASVDSDGTLIYYVNAEPGTMLALNDDSLHYKLCIYDSHAVKLLSY